MAMESSIINHIQEVYEYLEHEEWPVVTFIAPTGSGKTIGVALYMFLQKKRTIIICPKTIAALGAAQFMIELNDRLSLPRYPKIGYAAGNVHYYDNNSDIIFMTAGHFYKRMMELYSESYREGFINIMFDRIDYLIIDDAHTPSLEYGLIELILSYSLSVRREQGYDVPQVLLMSAIDFTSNNFRSNEELSYLAELNPKVNALTPSQYPVNVVYTPLRNKNMKGIVDSINRLIENILPGGVNNIIADRPVLSLGQVCLVFLAGRIEIDLLEKRLEENRIVTIRRLHSGIRQMDNVTTISIPEPDKVVIILSTPIAETSITISQLAVVIDSMREKVMYSNLDDGTGRNGGNILRTKMITKASAQQRLGRLGRTMMGTCYRLIEEKQFDKLEEFRTNELHRVNLQPIIVDFISNGIPLTALKTVNYHSDVQDLIDKDIVNSSGIHLRLTSYGKFGVGLVLSPRSSKVLHLCMNDAVLSKYMYECISVMAVVESGPYFRNTTDEALANAFSSFGPDSPVKPKSDLHSNVLFFIEYLTVINGLRVHGPAIQKSISWIQDYSASERKVNDTLWKIREVISVYESRYGPITIGVPQWTVEGELLVDRVINKMLDSHCYDLLDDNVEVSSWFQDRRPLHNSIISISGIRDGVARFTAFT